jgi:hypothetical protein
MAKQATEQEKESNKQSEVLPERCWLTVPLKGDTRALKNQSGIRVTNRASKSHAPPRTT